jgi:PKD repeat protein
MKGTDGTGRRLFPVLICLLMIILGASSASAVTLSVQNLDLTGSGTNGSSALILDSAPNGLSGFKINATMGTPGVARITDAVFPSAFSAMNSKTSLPAEEVRVVGVDLLKSIEPGASNIVLCTFTLQGVSSGTTHLQLSIGELTDDSGSPIVATLNNAVITVGSPSPSPSPSPAPGMVDFSASPRSGAAPLTVHFTPVVNGSVSGYVWSFGDDSSSDQASPSHIYAAGTYNVALLASFVSGGSASISKAGYITVSGDSPTPTPTLTVTPTPTPTPVPLVADFTGSPISGVPPLSVQFTDLSRGNPTKWKWSFGDGTIGTTKDPLHIYGGLGRYTVTLEVENRASSSIIRKSEFVKVKG